MAGKNPLLVSSFLTVVLSSLPTPAQGSGLFTEQVLFRQGWNGYHTYRIPAVVEAADGSVLAFCEARKYSSGDRGDIDLVLRRSNDGGKTWTPMQVVWDDGKNTIGNPAPVLDRSTGVIWLLFCWNNKRVFVTSSHDGGKSWKRPTEITSFVKRPGWTWYATGPCHAVQLERGPQKGRLLVPCDHRDPGYGYGSHMVYSDDHGKSWRLGGIIKGRGTYHPNECSVTELVDGRVYVNARNQGGSPRRRLVAFSKDGGLTFTPVTFDPALPDPTVQASTVRYSSADKGGKKNRILFSNPATTSSRTRMTVRISEDETLTWPVARLVHAGPSAYSDLVVLSNGNIGLFYEKGKTSPYETLTFARFDLAWLDPPPPEGKICVESFEYGAQSGSPISLEGKKGGTGWAGPWITSGETGLLGWWKMEGDARDSSGRGNDGTLRGPTFSRDVPSLLKGSTRSLLFDGKDDYLDLSAKVKAFSGLRDGTLSVWFKSTGSGTHTLLAASDHRDPSREIRLILEKGKLIFDVRGDLSSGGWLASPGAVNDGRWHHAAVTVDLAGRAVLYLDGNAVASGAQPFFSAVRDLDRMALGRNVDSGGGQWYFTGFLDDAAVLGRSLEPAQVALLAKGIPPSAFQTKDPPGTTLKNPGLATSSFPCPAFRSLGGRSAGDRVSEGGASDAWRPLARSLPMSGDADFYLSCLLRRVDGGAGPSPFSLHLVSGGSSLVRMGWDEKGKWILGASGSVVKGGAMTAGSVYFVFLKVHASRNGKDQVFLKAYRPGDVVPAGDGRFKGQGGGADQWTLIGPSFSSGATIDSLFLDFKDTGSTVEVDEIKICSTWAGAAGQDPVVYLFGTGCAGSNGIPVLMSRGLPYLGSSSFALRLLNGPPFSPGLLFWGLARAASPLPLGGGCFFYLDYLPPYPVSLLGPITTGATGNAHFPLPIPSRPGLLEGRAYFQGVLADRAVPGSFTVTNGLKVRL